MGPHAFMCVICIGIFLYYDMLERARTFDIYVRHDILRTFSFLWRPGTCNALCSTKSDLGSTYTSPLGGLICAYVGHVWRSVIHPTLSGSKKSLRLYKLYKR